MRDAPLAAIRSRYTRALSQALQRLMPGVPIDSRGYVDRPENNLLPGIALNDFEADLGSGAGKELEGKFRAAHSSSALAVNCFAPFRQDGRPIPLRNHTDFRVAGFEQRFPTGLPRAQPPHLDIVANGQGGMVAIECKCTEYLSKKQAWFSDRYETGITDSRADGPWFAEMRRLKVGRRYELLDAAQLIKHAFGLAHCLDGEPVALVYLYLEPRDADLSPCFAQHRSEIAEFAERIAAGYPAFQAMTYSQLWGQWAATGDAEMVTHVERLRARYEVALWA